MTTLTYTGEDMFVRGLNATNGTPFRKKDFEEMVPIEGKVAHLLNFVRGEGSAMRREHNSAKEAMSGIVKQLEAMVATQTKREGYFQQLANGDPSD